jgi:hypothetical protein
MNKNGKGKTKCGGSSAALLAKMREQLRSE